MTQRRSDRQASHDAFRAASIDRPASDQVHRLDWRLGYGVGATRERERLKKRMADEWRAMLRDT